MRMQYLPVYQLGTEKLEGWKHMYRYAMKDAQCTTVPVDRGSARVSFPLYDWSSCAVGLTYKLQTQIRSRISKTCSLSLSVYEGRQGRSEP